MVALFCMNPVFVPFEKGSDQISDPSTNLVQSSGTHQSIHMHEAVLNPINESSIEVWITT